MSENHIWFEPKRYGFGTGLPIAWQGWLLSGSFLTLMIAIAMIFHDRTTVAVAIIIPAVILFMIISAKTTRGGWRWRWGGQD